MEPMSAGTRATDAELDDALARAIRLLIAEAVEARGDEARGDEARGDEAPPIAADTTGSAAA